VSKPEKIRKYSVGDIVEYYTYAWQTGEKKSHIGTIIRGAKVPNDAIYQIRRASNRSLDMEIWEKEIVRRVGATE